MSVEALCEANMVWSDNLAANLLLPAIGGPAGLTHFCRSLGDSQFRLGRTEAALSEAVPGNPPRYHHAARDARHAEPIADRR
ncbi:MAG: putative Beta-lactamase [Rhodospirillales bacterium]|jgi:beta-lactamase class A|nr:putative Beta-lactamase [Rhodospirillales bacterium]MDB5383052.1 putative Beta-lactamase [Rhodospirillales bacterium]